MAKQETSEMSFKSIMREIGMFLLFTGVATFSVYFLARIVMGV